VIRSASPGTRARLTYTFPARACPPAGRERPFRAAVHRLHGTRRVRSCTELCTAFSLMLKPPSLPSPRWRWRALPEALEEASCHGWHLRDS
jgi:hypothetical protein